MRFYALQVTCETCTSTFLVGGATKNDLASRRDAVVECVKCGAPCPARNGRVVDLTPAPARPAHGTASMG